MKLKLDLWGTVIGAFCQLDILQDRLDVFSEENPVSIRSVTV